MSVAADFITSPLCQSTKSMSGARLRSGGDAARPGHRRSGAGEPESRPRYGDCRGGRRRPHRRHRRVVRGNGPCHRRRAGGGTDPHRGASRRSSRRCRERRHRRRFARAASCRDADVSHRPGVCRSRAARQRCPLAALLDRRYEPEPGERVGILASGGNSAAVDFDRTAAGVAEARTSRAILSGDRRGSTGRDF